MSDSLQHRLQERVKELTALHSTARLLQDTTSPLDDVASAVAALLPPAWMHPDSAESRIRCGARGWSTPGFRETPWLQREAFKLRDGQTGDITVAYRDEQPPADEGPFLAAERERRRIAEDLHDHLGQALALLKIRLRSLRGDAMFSGHDAALEELVALSDQAIRYTRGLTFELSPPILYELGLGPALEWLGEDTARRHGLRVDVRDITPRKLPDDLKVMLWKSARELLHNVVKHARAHVVVITLECRDHEVVLIVADDGNGFDPALARRDAGAQFGLFSIEERLGQLGGRMDLETGPGRGTRVILTAGIPGGDR